MQIKNSKYNNTANVRTIFMLWRCIKYTTYLCLCMRALKARPSLQQVEKFWMLTSEYLAHGEIFCNFKCKPRSTNVAMLTY